jgi:hypothetical protein
MNVQFHPSGFAASEQLKEFIEKRLAKARNHLYDKINRC